MNKTILEFISKFITENDRWILWMSISIGLWIGYIFFHNEWVLITAIIATSFVILSFVRTVYSYIKTSISKYRAKRHIKKKILLDEQTEKENEHKRRKEREDIVWKLVAYANHSQIVHLSKILDCDVFDEGKHIYFLPFYSENYDKSHSFSEIRGAVGYFHSICNNGTRSGLLKEERLRDGAYITIEPYFYQLLKHYTKTKKWEKL